jgi:hypothetical protein
VAASVKIVTVYTPGALLKETEDAMFASLRARISNTVWLRIPIDGSDDRAYGRLLAAHWNSHEALFVLEPDIICRPDVLEAMEDCPEPYCAFPYELLTDVMPALGCTRFSADFMARYPKAMSEAVSSRVGFRQFDIVFQRHILVAKHGEQPHVHLPQVEHKNEAKKLRSDASSEPLTTLPGFTFPVRPERE